MKKLIKSITTGSSIIPDSVIDSPVSFRLFLVYSIICVAYQFSGLFSWPLHVYFAPYLDSLPNIVFIFAVLISISLLRSPCARNVNSLLMMQLLMLFFGVYDCISHHWGFGDPLSLGSPSDYHPARVFFNIFIPLIWIFTVIPDLHKWNKTIEQGADGKPPSAAQPPDKLNPNTRLP